MSKRICIFILLFCLSGHASILADPPDWQVNPANYQYNMTGIFRVFKNNASFMNEPESMVGIFAGNQLRGVVQSNDIIFVNGQAYFPANMFSNTQAGDTLTFKVYVPSFDSIFNANEYAIFDRTISLGTPQNPFLLTITTCTDILILTTSDSPVSGTYRAAQEIRLQGDIVVPEGTTVTLDAPVVKSQGLFTPGQNSQVVIKAGGCL